jgi:16S rRNA (cytidine1402-2'-O)-methyltransferase
LVDAAHEAGVRVVPVPGPSAVATLLSASGLPADRYVFEGFLPHREGERRRRLRELAAERRTLVFFEAPHRIHQALADLQEVFGERRVVLGRELTKLHETILRGTAAEVAAGLGTEVRGEITLVVAGARGAARAADERARRVLERWNEALRESGGDRRAALRQAARALGLKRAELHRYLAELDTPADGRGSDR